MSRTPRLDLRYEHQMRAVPLPAMVAPPPSIEARTLVARLRCLNAMMEAERGHLAAWLAGTPRLVLS